MMYTYIHSKQCISYHVHILYVVANHQPIIKCYRSVRLLADKSAEHQRAIKSLWRKWINSQDFKRFKWKTCCCSIYKCLTHEQHNLYCCCCFVQLTSSEIIKQHNISSYILISIAAVYHICTFYFLFFLYIQI